MILDLPLTRFVLRLDLSKPLLRIVAGDGCFDGLAVEGAHLLGASYEVLPRLRQETLGRCGARLQGIEPHIQAAAFGRLPTPTLTNSPARRDVGGTILYRLSHGNTCGRRL